MNCAALIIVGILGLALVVFTIIRNQKDEKYFEETKNNNNSKLNEDIYDDGIVNHNVI